MNYENMPLLGSSYLTPHGARYAGNSEASDIVEVTIVLEPSRPIDQHTINERGTMLPRERSSEDRVVLAQRHGADERAVAEIVAFAKGNDLSVVSVDAARRTVDISGTVARMEQSFHVNLRNYELNGGTFRAQHGAVELPATIAPHVVAVLGLDERPLLKPCLLSAPESGYQFHPSEVAALYHFPEADGTGTTIALLQFGGVYSEDDLRTYFGSAGVPRIVKHEVLGYGGRPYGLASAEVMLDIELVGSLVPAAEIAVYFAPNHERGLYEALKQAVHDPGTTAISISWGWLEEFMSDPLIRSIELLARDAALLDVAVFAACGDSGATNLLRDVDPRNVNFPASAPTIAACGGTTLYALDGTITSETVWNNSHATGGGVSSFFPVPPRQDGLSAERGVPLSGRGVPDVAGNADPATGYYARYNGRPVFLAGTSAVAPLWAALVARLSQRIGRNVGWFMPLLYRYPSVCNDIRCGNNAVGGLPGYAAQPGWDACTGLGSPDGGRILDLLSQGVAPSRDDTVGAAECRGARA